MAHEWAKGLVAATLLIGLVAAVMPIQAWKQDTPRQESYEGLADALFGTWLLPFELLSVLLLVALIGALYLSDRRRKEEAP